MKDKILIQAHKATEYQWGASLASIMVQDPWWVPEIRIDLLKNAQEV